MVLRLQQALLSLCTRPGTYWRGVEGPLSPDKVGEVGAGHTGVPSQETRHAPGRFDLKQMWVRNIYVDRGNVVVACVCRGLPVSIGTRKCRIRGSFLLPVVTGRLASGRDNLRRADGSQSLRQHSYPGIVYYSGRWRLSVKRGCSREPNLVQVIKHPGSGRMGGCCGIASPTGQGNVPEAKSTPLPVKMDCTI